MKHYIGCFFVFFIVISSKNMLAKENAIEIAEPVNSNVDLSKIIRSSGSKFEASGKCISIDFKSMLDSKTGKPIVVGSQIFNETIKSSDGFVEITTSCYFSKKGSNLIIRNPTLEKWSDVNLNFPISLYGSQVAVNKTEDCKAPEFQPRCPGNYLTIEFDSPVSYAKILAAVESAGYWEVKDPRKDPCAEGKKEPRAFPGTIVFLHENNDEQIGAEDQLKDLGYDHPSKINWITRGDPMSSSPMVKKIRLGTYSDMSNVMVFSLCYIE